MDEHGYTQRNVVCEMVPSRPAATIWVVILLSCDRCGCLVLDTATHDQVCARPEHKVREPDRVSRMKPPTILPIHLVDPSKPLTDAPICTALSPESQTQCALPDLPLWHSMGHQSETWRSGLICWGTSAEDHERWGWPDRPWSLTDVEQAQAEQQHLLFRAWCYLRDQQRREHR